MKKEFHKILDIDILKKNMLMASLYLTGYELLKSQIVNSVKDFFIDGIDEKGVKYSTNYETVTKKHKKVFEESCLWLAELDAINKDEVMELQKIRIHRDEIAHKMPVFLSDDNSDINEELLLKMKYFVDKIGRFWGSIEVDIDEELAGKVDYEQIKSSYSMLFDYLNDIINEIKE